MLSDLIGCIILGLVVAGSLYWLLQEVPLALYKKYKKK